MDEINGAVGLIFTTVQIVAMVYCYFSLITTMTANIWEQSKEIAILRAIGLTRRKLTLIYIAEAFLLVFSSSFMGVIIGSVVGFTMIKQNTLFLRVPLPFLFPWGQSDYCVLHRTFQCHPKYNSSD